MPRTMSSDTPDKGQFRIHVDSALNRSPVENARIRIFDTGQPEKLLEEIGTDTNGNSETVELPAPPLEYSMEPGENQPYSEYTFQIEADGYEPFSISGAELFSGSLALQDVKLSPKEASGSFQNYTVPAHTLFGNYPPKIAEAEIKPIRASGEIVLSRVVVPEYIVVHDGSPRDSTAEDHYVRYSDYIKNVASSEIYATWPRATITANVLAIMSFTLNRVYTEWYRNKGYSFTITSSTAFDHKWIPNRNIFESISEVVDEVFASYLSRPNVRQPILTQYCDGQRVSCPNWLSQWGSKYLGDQNYTPVEILRYYYGEDLYINSAEEISGIPVSWPGETLDIGSRGQKVEQLQEQLNAISNHYPLIPKIQADSIYGEETQRAVETFQGIFGLPETGEVDYRTWYKIQEIYVGVTRIAELY